MSDEDMSEYLAGNKLYGDDFNPEEIQKWFEDEKEAYANLGAKESTNYSYAYHELNRRHGFNYLPRRRFTSVLGFGSAYGNELKPIDAFLRQCLKSRNYYTTRHHQIVS